jgi:hypothetical protein
MSGLRSVYNGSQSRRKRIWSDFNARVRHNQNLCQWQDQWLRLALSNGPDCEVSFSSFSLITEADPISEVFILPESYTMEKKKGQKLSNFKHVVPSSEPFRIYNQYCILKFELIWI